MEIDENKEVMSGPVNRCEECGKFIYDESEVYRYKGTKRVRTGRTSHSEEYEIPLCKECYDRKMENIRIAAENSTREARAAILKRRVHSFVWAGLLGVLALVLGIIAAGPIGILVGVLVYTFVGCLILNNTFITGMFLGIMSWGFVKMPGVIFELSLDGIIALIFIKLLFALIAFLIAICGVALALALSLPLSLFAYPFGLAKSFKYQE